MRGVTINSFNHVANYWAKRTRNAFDGLLPPPAIVVVVVVVLDF